MIYIIIVLSSIMAFYFFTVAFISSKENNSLPDDFNEEEKTYYDEPQIEKVKDITYGLTKIFDNKKNDEVENKDDTTSVPKIIQSSPIEMNKEEEMPALIASMPVNSEQSSVENIDQNNVVTSTQNNLICEEKKIIIDEEII